MGARLTIFSLVISAIVLSSAAVTFDDCFPTFADLIKQDPALKSVEEKCVMNNITVGQLLYLSDDFLQDQLHLSRAAVEQVTVALKLHVLLWTTSHPDDTGYQSGTDIPSCFDAYKAPGSRFSDKTDSYLAPMFPSHPVIHQAVLNQLGEKEGRVFLSIYHTSDHPSFAYWSNEVDVIPVHVPDEEYLIAVQQVGQTLLEQGRLHEAIAVWSWLYLTHRHTRKFNPLLGDMYTDPSESDLFNKIVTSTIPHSVKTKTNYQPKAMFPHRLRHDSAQAELLLSLGLLAKDEAEAIIDIYEALFEILMQGPATAVDNRLQLPDAMWVLVAPYWNRVWYAPSCEILPLGLSAVRPSLRGAEAKLITTQYYATTPHVLVVDNLLTPLALHRFTQYFQQACVWHEMYPGYLGISIRGGLAVPLLGQLVNELRETFPDILCQHDLVQSWAFKYEPEVSEAIGLHADQAAVNVNIWLSPDENNLDPKSGGLVVYLVIPPQSWTFDQFNTYDEAGLEKIDGLLKETGYKNLTVPHKYNRAVMFESDLFHKSDKFQFKRGYLNRRINLTLLFGKRGDKCVAAPAEQKNEEEKKNKEKKDEKKKNEKKKNEEKINEASKVNKDDEMPSAKKGALEKERGKKETQQNETKNKEKYEEAIVVDHRASERTTE